MRKHFEPGTSDIQERRDAIQHMEQTLELTPNQRFCIQEILSNPAHINLEQLYQQGLISYTELNNLLTQMDASEISAYSLFMRKLHMEVKEAFQKLHNEGEKPYAPAQYNFLDHFFSSLSEAFERSLTKEGYSREDLEQAARQVAGAEGRALEQSAEAKHQQEKQDALEDARRKKQELLEQEKLLKKKKKEEEDGEEGSDAQQRRPDENNEEEAVTIQEVVMEFYAQEAGEQGLEMDVDPKEVLLAAATVLSRHHGTMEGETGDVTEVTSDEQHSERNTRITQKSTRLTK